MGGNLRVKSSFSTSWNASIQPRKQRKYRHNAPLHIRHTFLSAHLSKELRNKYGKRNLPLRKGDEVLVMRGSFVKKKAKVISVDTQNIRVALEGIQRSKRDGTKVSVSFAPRALQIIALAEDKERLIALARRKPTASRKESSSEIQEKNHASNKTRNNA